MTKEIYSIIFDEYCIVVSTNIILYMFVGYDRIRLGKKKLWGAGCRIR